MSERPTTWSRMTIAGFHAMGARRYAEAGRLWISVNAELDVCSADDPRRATALSNAGVGHALLDATEEAKAELEAAERCWTRLLNLAGSSDLALAAGSSAFHFRLASNNLEAFQSVRRTQLKRQCQAALAISRFNWLAVTSGGAAATMAPTLAALLSDVHGSGSPDVRLLQADSAEPDISRTTASAYALKAAEIDGRYGSPDAWPTDIWQLLGPALALQALLHPAVVIGVGAGSAADSEEGSTRVGTRTSGRQ